LESVLGYTVEQNRTLKLRGQAAIEAGNPNQRPDLIVYTDADAHQRVVTRFGS